MNTTQTRTWSIKNGFGEGLKGEALSIYRRVNYLMIFLIMFAMFVTKIMAERSGLIDTGYVSSIVYAIVFVVIASLLAHTLIYKPIDMSLRKLQKVSENHQ